MKASDLFLKCLENEGVGTIYGVPGEENADLMISLLDSPIEFITCRHEQGAAFMADIHGRLTGNPGVCLATLGPGATNLVTGVANANMDRSPVVAIAGQAETTRLHKESHQNMDIVSMFEPITKWSSSIYHAENIPEVVRKSFKIATAEKPGACLVELPEDVAGEEIDTHPFTGSLKVRRPGPDPKAIKAAFKLLSTATKPIILAGAGTVRTRASKHLRRFVKQTGIFGATTFMAKGSISDRDGRSLFTGGLQSRDHVTEAFREADLVICIGYDMVEWHPSVWNQGKDKAIIHIDFEAAEVDDHYLTDVEVVGDIAASIWALMEEMGDMHFGDIPDFAKERSHIEQEMADEASSDAFPMKPQRILKDLRDVMDDEDILISDVGAHKMWVARHYPTYSPGSCIISNGFCSMGIAVPGAIAAKKLKPEKRVVGLCGDGGFLMNVQELATAVQYNIPTTFMIWQDDGYGLIKWKQEARFGRSSHTEIHNPDLLKLAQSFGCQGIEVGAANELTPALEKAFAQKTKPTVIIVKVDYSENMKLTERLGRVIGRS
jgi:acetolactate synthase I/II/III large subunit